VPKSLLVKMCMYLLQIRYTTLKSGRLLLVCNGCAYHERCRPEYTAWAALLVSEISKIQGSSSTGNLRPSVAAALSELRGYYSTGQTPTDTPLDGSDDEDIEEFGQIWSSKLGNNQSRGGRGREVELSALPLTNHTASNNGATAVGLTEERLRRRKHADDLRNCNLTPFEHASSLQSAFAERSNGGAIAQGQFSHQPGQSFDFNFSTSSRRGSLHARGASAGDVLGELRVWHRKSLVWKDQFLQKLKKAASNSSLLAPRTSADYLQAPSTSLSMSGPLVDRSASIHITSTSSGSMSGASQGRGGPHPQKDGHKAD
jgi:hypothetical protein